MNTFKKKRESICSWWLFVGLLSVLASSICEYMNTVLMYAVRDCSWDCYLCWHLQSVNTLMHACVCVSVNTLIHACVCVYMSNLNHVCMYIWVLSILCVCIYECHSYNPVCMYIWVTSILFVCIYECHSYNHVCMYIWVTSILCVCIYEFTNTWMTEAAHSPCSAAVDIWYLSSMKYIRKIKKIKK